MKDKKNLIIFVLIIGSIVFFVTQSQLQQRRYNFEMYNNAYITMKGIVDNLQTLNENELDSFGTSLEITLGKSDTGFDITFYKLASLFTEIEELSQLTSEEKIKIQELIQQLGVVFDGKRETIDYLGDYDSIYHELELVIKEK